jgi:nitroreductase
VPRASWLTPRASTRLSGGGGGPRTPTARAGGGGGAPPPHDYAERLEQVPLHLVVGVRLEDLAVTDAGLPRQSIVGGASVYPFVQNLLLAARAEGLGAALTTLLVPAEAEVKQLLGIPDGVALAAHIGLGYRVEAWPRKLARKPVSEFAFGERWGEPLT